MSVPVSEGEGMYIDSVREAAEERLSQIEEEEKAFTLQPRWLLDEMPKTNLPPPESLDFTEDDFPLQ